MIGALVKSVKQLLDPKSRKILFLSLGLAILVFLFLGWLVSMAQSALPESGNDFTDMAARFGIWIVFVGVAGVIFPSVVSLFIGVFIDAVVDATEALHYPDHPAGQAPPLMETVWAAMKYGGTVIGANLAVLPLYFLVFWFPPAIAIIYYSLNAFLLSREFFELVAHRHMSWAEARALRKANQGRIFIAGLIIAVMFTMPIVNLMAPIIATSFMVHLYMGVTRTRSKRQRPVHSSMRERLERNELP